MFFIVVSEDENKISKEAFFKRPPDAIVVFTGDKGRIGYGLQKAREYNQPRIFITGVYSKNSVDTLLDLKESVNPPNPDMIEIDYLASNTVENVLSTLRYLRKNKGLKRILLVSHDYHIMRIKIIMNQLSSEKETYEFYYSGIETKYDNFRSLKILYKEVFKITRTWGFLMLWDPDVRSPLN
ncbi:MAG: YdcF family protein [Bacteriovoracaceae bacterium]|nr:YdcF family protein [Bacteriovoracaceae bacterium]